MYTHYSSFYPFNPALCQLFTLNLPKSVKLANVFDLKLNTEFVPVACMKFVVYDSVTGTGKDLQAVAKLTVVLSFHSFFATIGLIHIIKLLLDSGQNEGSLPITGPTYVCVNGLWL